MAQAHTKSVIIVRPYLGKVRLLSNTFEAHAHLGRRFNRASWTVWITWVRSGGRFQGLVWISVEDCYEWGGTQEHFPRLSVYREAVDPLEEAP